MSDVQGSRRAASKQPQTKMVLMACEAIKQIVQEQINQVFVHANR